MSEVEKTLLITIGVLSFILIIEIIDKMLFKYW